MNVNGAKVGRYLIHIYFHQFSFHISIYNDVKKIKIKMIKKIYDLNRTCRRPSRYVERTNTLCVFCVYYNKKFCIEYNTRRRK